MWTLYNFLGETLRRGPSSDRAERLMPYVLMTLAALIAGIMLYAYLTAPSL